MGDSEATRAEKVAVQRFEGGESEIAIFEFEGALRDLMVSSPSGVGRRASLPLSPLSGPGCWRSSHKA